VLAVRWLPSPAYGPFGYFITAVREGAVLLLQHSISTVFNPDTDGQKYVSCRLGLARMFPSKIVIIAPSLLTFPVISHPWRFDSTLQVTSGADSFLLTYPLEPSVLQFKYYHLLPASNTPELGLPVAAPLGNQSVETLDPDKARLFPYAYYLKSNEIWRFSVVTGRSSLFLSVSEGQVMVRNFALTFRPHTVTDKLQFLIMKDVKGKRIATILSALQGQTTQTLYTCHDAVLLGPEDQTSSLLLLLSEAQDSVTALDLASGTEKAAFMLEGRLLKAAWTPLASGFAVLYETLSDHSLVLSRSAISNNPLDIQLDPKLRFRLRLEERVSVLSWHRTYLKLCLGTSQRISVLDHNLSPLCEVQHAQPTHVTSLLWLGNTVLLTAQGGLYYCYNKGKVKLATMPQDSVLIHAAIDRVTLLRSEEEVLVRPMLLLEPLLLNYLSLPARSPALIHHFIEKLDTSLISEALISALNREKLYSAAVHLIETYNLPQVSLRCKAEAYLGARRLEGLWKLLEVTDNERESLRRGGAELQVLTQLLERLEALGQISKVATVYERLQLDVQFAMLVKHTLPHNEAVSGGNPYLHMLDRQGEPMELRARSLTDFAQIAQQFQDKPLASKPIPIKRTQRGFKESAFVLKTLDNIEIHPISGDSFTQWIGFDSVHEPGLAPAEGKEGFQEAPGFAEEPQEVKLLAYFHCDEGTGECLGDIVTGKGWTISATQWLGQLEDGLPLDYEDKWGKAAPPSYALDCQAPIVLSGLALPKTFTIELWFSLRPDASGFLLALDSVELPVSGSALLPSSLFQPSEDREVEAVLSPQLWTHLTLLSDAGQWMLFLNAKLALQRAAPGQATFDTLRLGPLPAKFTEIRLWSGAKSLVELRENLKCPLDIVNERKKKAWSGMTIKKAGSTGAPAQGGLKLAPPGGKKLGLLAPPSKPSPPPEPKTEAQPRVEVALDVEPRLEEVNSALEAGDYAEALLAINRKLRQLGDQLTRADDSEVSSLQPLLETSVAYRLALTLTLRVDTERQQASLEAQQRAAELGNLLIQVKTRPKHRRMFAQLALELNINAGNYGIALKVADQLLNSKGLCPTQIESISTQKTLCQANESRDKGLLACPCPSCQAPLPAGAISKKCAGCRALLRFCYLTFVPIAVGNALSCPVCTAVYIVAEGRTAGDLCAYCGLARLAAGFPASS
jgi:hypothetical protein